MGQEVQVAPIFADREENKNLAPKEVKEEKSSRKRWNQTAVIVRSEHEFIWVASAKKLYWRDKDEVLYRAADNRQLDKWVGEALLRNYGEFCTRDIDEVKEQLKLIVTEEVDSPSLDCIMITENIFWDRVNGELTRTPTSPVFYRLMSTKKATKHTPKIPKLTTGQEEALWQMYQTVKEELQKGKEVERFEPLKVWADGSHDVYMDLHRAHAYTMLQKKPMGSYILIGVARNGKSAYVGFTKAIMGMENSSDLQISDLTNYRMNHKLNGVLMNAPDEEDEKILDMAATFKTMSDHGILTLEVMRSQEPISVDCDFMSFFPMNHTPKWTGSGSTACVKRSLIIPFTADLSKFDKTNDNFAEKTFTADFMAEYLGSMFAYAWYYHRNELVFSTTMYMEQEMLEEDIDNGISYRKQFDKYFDGFESDKLLYADYMAWCTTNGYTFKKKDKLTFIFNDYKAHKSSYRKADGTIRPVRRIPKPNHRPLMSDFVPEEHILPGHLSVEEMHEKGLSIVAVLEEYYAQKMAEGVVNEPSR